MTRATRKRLIHAWMLLASAFFALGPSIASAACCCCSPEAAASVVAGESDDTTVAVIATTCPHCASCQPDPAPIREHCPADQDCRCHDFPDAMADGNLVRVSDLDVKQNSVVSPTIGFVGDTFKAVRSYLPPDPAQGRTASDFCVHLCRWLK